MSIRVLLLALNARFSHSNLALYYMKSIIEKEQISCELKEHTLKDNPRNLLDSIHLSPEPFTHLCLSVYIWNSSLIRDFLEDFKKLYPSVKVILGGPEVSYNPELWLQYFPDAFVVVGPGEPVLLPILHGEIKAGKVLSPPVPAEEIIFPYSPEDLELLENRLVYYETSRGCPFSCSYCLSACDDQPLQLRPLDVVFTELGLLARSKARTIKLVDRSFNSDPKRARAIWQYILEQKESVSFHFEIHPLFLEEDDFKLLSRVPGHLFHFEIGIQTTSQQELKAVNRSGDWQSIRGNIERLLRETDIPVHLDQIVGLPQADWDSVVDSFNQILSLKPQEFQMGFLKVIPGTPLAVRREEGMISSSRPPYEVYQTKSLSYAMFNHLHGIEEVLNAYYNSALFPRSMDRLIQDDLPYGENPFLLFDQLREVREKKSSQSRQWARLAELLWQVVTSWHPEVSGPLIDNLRRDWAPLSQGQYLPGFLQYEKGEQIKKLRRALWPLCESDGVSSSEFKRSLLILLEAPDSDEDLLLSLPLEGGRIERSFRSDLLGLE